MWTGTLFSIFSGAAIKSVAVLAIAWGASLLMRRQSAAARHLAWTAAAAALLALPFLSASLPPLRLSPSLVSTAGFETSAVDHASVATAIDRLTRPDDRTQTNDRPARPVRSRFDWRIGLMLVWAAGTAVALLKLLVGVVAIQRARRSAQPYADRQLPAELAQALGIRDRVEVLESRAGSMPMTFGFRRPAVFMPSDASAWTEDRRRIVLLHELAHVRRGDVAAHLFTRAVLALYWWNPLAWFAWREFLKERERATDDLVLNAGARASDYAGHLLEVARNRAPLAMSGAAIAMARRSQLEGRLLAILDSNVNRSGARRAGTWIAAAIAVVLIAPLAAVRAQDAASDDVDAVIRAAVSQHNYEMLDSTAKAAEQLSRFDAAKKLLDAAAQIREQTAGAKSPEYAIGLLKLGDLEQKRNDRSTAEGYYSSAVELLGDRAEAAPALIFLGTSAASRMDVSAATMYFSRAQQADPAHAGIAMMWQATMKQHDGDAFGAESLFKSALGVAEPGSIDAATIMRVYARFLKEQGRAEETTGLISRADEIDKASGKSVHTVQTGAGPYKVGGDVSQPKLLSKTEPSYTEEARIAKLEGTVQLTGIIGTDGVAHDLQVLQSLSLGLDQAAIRAVSQWKFQPGMKDGEPVPVIATIQVNFRLL